MYSHLVTVNGIEIFRLLVRFSMPHKAIWTFPSIQYFATSRSNSWSFWSSALYCEWTELFLSESGCTTSFPLNTRAFIISAKNIIIILKYFFRLNPFHPYYLSSLSLLIKADICIYINRESDYCIPDSFPGNVPNLQQYGSIA